MATQVIAYVPVQVPGAAHQPEHPEPRVTTVLVCDNALLRLGLQDILQGTPFALAGTTSTANPAVVQDMVSEPALVLIEVGLNTSHVLEVIRQVRGQLPQARIVALANQFDLGFVRLGHEVGVNGFCLAAPAPEVLIKSFELIMLGETVMPSVVLRSIMDGLSQNRRQPLQDHSIGEPKLSDLTSCKLSAREAQILSCLSEGAPNKAIARRLDVTEATIKVHVKAILRKIGAANRTQAAMWATKHLPSRGGGAAQHI